MNLDVFQLRDRVVEEYRNYVQSFVRVLDDRIDDFISSRLDEGELWPAAELQLNPAFEMDRTLGELAAQGIIKPETARFFGEELRLFQHQREAIDIALRGESYVVTTGTGSGKSLTYLVPCLRRDHPQPARQTLGSHAADLPDERADQQPTRSATKLPTEELPGFPGAL